MYHTESKISIKREIIVEDPYAEEFEATRREKESQMQIDAMRPFTTDVHIAVTPSRGIWIPTSAKSSTIVSGTTYNSTSVVPHMQLIDDKDDDLSVVLDCANIGWSYGKSKFDVAGVEIALRFFHSLGIKTVSFLPTKYAKSKRSSDYYLMEDDEVSKVNTLVSTNQIALVPPGNHDDVYILSYASNHNSYVASNDFYADHVRSIEDESVRDQTRRWIRYYRCSFVFVGKELMLNPKSAFFDELRSRRITMPMEITPTSSDDSNSEEMISHVVHLLSQAVELLALRADSADEMRHVLLARAKANIKLCRNDLAKDDLSYCLKNAPNNVSQEALEMLLNITS